MIVYMDTRYTPRQVAKKLIEDKLELALGYWQEDSSLEADQLTERESDLIQDQLDKLVTAITKNHLVIKGES
jgi:hypothetical protein